MLWYCLLFIPLALFLVFRGVYRRSVPNARYLLEQDFHRRTYPFERNRSEYRLRGARVPRYEMPFVWMDYLSLTWRNEIGVRERTYYKGVVPCSGSAFDRERDRFEHALREALKRRQGRMEYVTHLHKLAPYDYYEEGFFRKAPEPSQLAF